MYEASKVVVVPQKTSHSAPQSPASTPPLQGPLDRASFEKKSLLKRQVSFPDDKFIVTSYFEPPVPWLQSNEMCAEEVIEAYKTSCIKYGVSPINTVISQIKKIDNFEGRYKELNLSGEQLSPLQCEALEEVFKRVQFEDLHLKSCYLEDEASMALFDMLEFYEVTTKLNISYNNAIATRGWHACSRMLKKTPCLDSFDASCTTLNEQCMPILCRSLRLGSNLSILSLNNCDITAKTFMILVAALKMNTSIRELYLMNNLLTTSDGYQLDSLLRCNTRLNTIDLSSNKLQDTGISNGIDGLANQLCVVGDGLINLVLKDNGCSSKCMADVSIALQQSKTLESLDLSINSITDDGILKLKEGLMTNRYLLNLNLHSCDITCEGAVAIAEYIADNTTIQNIDLRGNGIKYGGCMALALSMKVNTSVTSLDLDLPTDVENDESLYEYQQMFKEISNFCIRNRQFINNNILAADSEINKNIENCDSDSTEENANCQTDQVGRAQNGASSLSNSRFHVSRVQPSDTNTPKIVSGKMNGRFRVFKVNAVIEEAEPEADKPNDVKEQTNVAKNKVQFSLPAVPNFSGRRVTIDASVVPTVHKTVSNLKARRKSTPCLGTNLNGVSRESLRPGLKISINKQLECLDLRSTVPLSPGRVAECRSIPMSSVDMMMHLDESLSILAPSSEIS